MARRDSKAGDRLRQLKTQHQQQLQQLKEEISAQVLVCEQGLQQQWYGQVFYQEAMLNLLTSPDEPESEVLIGAVITQRWLRASGQTTLAQLREIRVGLR